ncbi:MAG: GNAT family N-acetyltransferase [Coprobacillaceae bacterium]
MEFRKTNKKDIPILMEMRKTQLIDEGGTPNEDINDGLIKFFNKRFDDQTLVQWVIEDNKEIVATAGIIFYELPPSYSNISGVKGYITNVYTKDAYRGQGLAKKLLNKLVEEAKSRNVKKLWLGASKMGRPVYEKFWFIEGDTWMEMDI